VGRRDGQQKKDGSLYWAYLTISPVKDASGEITIFVAVQENITGLKQAEDELRKAEAAEAASRSRAPSGQRQPRVAHAIVSHRWLR
jgi:hypothetical protein